MKKRKKKKKRDEVRGIDLSCVLGFWGLFFILLAIVKCYDLKWS